MFSTREEIALSLLSRVSDLESGSTDYYGLAKYRGAMLNAIQSILTLPSDVALPITVISSLGVREVRFTWRGDCGSRIEAVFTNAEGYGVIGAGNDNIVQHPDDHREWLLEALRNAGFIVRRQVPTGIRALEVE